MAKSLLAHLYSRIRGSQEDVATYALQYILSQSDDLNGAFNKILSDKLNEEIPTGTQYICQVTGNSEEKERPDMAGIDSNGKEVVLCEMKFYASLTHNQPMTYLKRLKQENGKGLVFVCPRARITSLWGQLVEITENEGYSKLSEYCMEGEGTKLSIVTWSEIIEYLKQTAASCAPLLMSDIVQLEGYCAQLDDEAFIPFTEDDLSSEMAIRGERYYAVIDEVERILKKDKYHKVEKNGYHTTANRNGYCCFVLIDGYAVTITYDRGMWKESSTVDTPFWMSIKKYITKARWERDELLEKKLASVPMIKKQDVSYGLMLALEPLQNATLQEVSENIVRQIFTYMDLVIKDNNLG